jgi:predicted dehydrogenase
MHVFSMGKARIIVIGAGEQIRRYTSFAIRFPHRLEIVGIAAPSQPGSAARNQSIPGHNCFCTWEDILSKPVFADGAVIAASEGGSPWAHALERGYHLMIENPEDITCSDFSSIITQSKKTGLSVSMCHTLRMEPFYATAKRVLDRGLIGTACSASLGRTTAAHPAIQGTAAERCHDIDLIHWFMGAVPSRLFSARGSTPEKMNSVSRTLFSFQTGAIAAFAENTNSDHETRTLRIDGTDGTLKGVLGKKVSLSLHLKDRKALSIADTPIIRRDSQDQAVSAFISSMSGPACVTAEEALAGCRIAFAVDKSCIEERMLDLKEYSGA